MAGLRANLPVARLAGHADLPQLLFACAQCFSVAFSATIHPLVESLLALVIASDKRGIAVRARPWGLVHAPW